MVWSTVATCHQHVLPCRATLAPPTTAAPRRLGLTSGPLARLLETSWVRGLDRFDGETEAVQMSTCRKWRPVSQCCTRFVACHCTFKLPHETLRNGTARRQETAPAARYAPGKPCYTPRPTLPRVASLRACCATCASSAYYSQAQNLSLGGRPVGTSQEWRELYCTLVLHAPVLRCSLRILAGDCVTTV